MTAEPKLSPQMLAFIRVIDRFVLVVARHWLFFANLILFIFSSLPLLAPVLMHYGYEAPARVLYWVYSLTCHQLAYRSFFFFGAQASYTVPQLQQLLQVNNPALDVFFWRDLVGNTQLGYKMAYCERDAAIYTSMLVAGLFYALWRGRIKPLNWKIYLLVAIAPIALDGFTQLFMWRESTPLLRAVTGILFGVFSVWLIYPHVNDAMQDTYAQSLKQLTRVNEHMSARETRGQ